MPTLYFSPLAGSLAARIACYHYEVEVAFVEVDLPGARFAANGGDYCDVHPLGQVPTLRTDDGRLLTETPVVLRAIAGLGARAPRPDDAEELSWLVFLGTEVHKGIFRPLFDPASNDGARAYARTKVPSRFAYLDAALTERKTLAEGLGLADMYLFTLMNFTRPAGIDLGAYPALAAAQVAHRGRPAFRRAFAEELPLFQAARARAEGRD